MRRTDRAVDAADAVALLKSGGYGVLSTVDAHSQPYGVPVNYVLIENENALYIHSAAVGHKLDNISAHPKVAFCVVGDTALLAGKFSTRYHSVIAFGIASVVAEDEKRAPLMALIEKYFPDELASGDAYIDKMIDKTAVIKVTLDRVTGKARQ